MFKGDRDAHEFPYGVVVMTKEIIVARANTAKSKDGIVSIVVGVTPKLNKFARTRDENGKRVPCPYATGTVRKVTKMRIDLNAKYVPVVRESTEGEAEKKPRAAWHKPTEYTFLKESINEPGKFYLFGKLVEATPEWFVDGEPVDKSSLAEYLPPEKDEAEDKDIWLTLNIDNITA